MLQYNLRHLVQSIPKLQIIMECGQLFVNVTKKGKPTKYINQNEQIIDAFLGHEKMKKIG